MANRRLQVFHAVAKHLSFTKAAETLFMTQPAVTFQVRQLEEHFGVRLFDRAPGGITLTSAGAIAFDYAERVLALLTELDIRVREIGGQVTGPLLIGASTTIAEFLLPQILGEFKARFPGLVPRLFVANSESVQSRLDARTLDLGFIEGDSHLPTLVSEVCCEDELEVVCAPSHALARNKVVTAQELRQHAYITREAGSGTREVTDHYFERAGIAPDSLDVVMELGSPEALKRLVGTGLGFAIISKTAVVKEIQLGHLVQIALSPRLLRNLSVVYPKERIHSRVVTTFVAFAKARLVALAANRASLEAPRFEETRC
jgi:DNA-binding transcriptional LysR family regulator